MSVGGDVLARVDAAEQVALHFVLDRLAPVLDEAVDVRG